LGNTSENNPENVPREIVSHSTIQEKWHSKNWHWSCLCLCECKGSCFMLNPSHNEPKEHILVEYLLEVLK
jgi:hypothetical protein